LTPAGNNGEDTGGVDKRGSVILVTDGHALVACDHVSEELKKWADI
jgi:hypothetical protein